MRQKLFNFFMVSVIPIIFYSHASAVQTPQLKWENAGGCTSWCQKAWYSSPAIADLDGDGSKEVIGAAYSISGLPGNGETLYVRLWSRVDGSWIYNTDYTCTTGI